MDMVFVKKKTFKKELCYITELESAQVHLPCTLTVHAQLATL